MPDLVSNSDSMESAARAISGITADAVNAGAVALSAIRTALEAISHPAFHQAVSEAYNASQRAHDVLHSGLSALSSFATTSAQAITQTDAELGQAATIHYVSGPVS